MNGQFLEILFSEEIQPDDLEFLRPATATQPGRVQLCLARVGKPCRHAPNSKPVFSRTGAKIGFVTDAAMIDQPYTDTYQLEEGAER